METRKCSSGKKATLTNKVDFYFTLVVYQSPCYDRWIVLLNATTYIDYHYRSGHYKSYVSESENSPKFFSKSSYFGAKSAKFSTFQKILYGKKLEIFKTIAENPKI